MNTHFNFTAATHPSFFIRENQCVCYTALTYLCQIWSDQPRCLGYLYHLLFVASLEFMVRNGKHIGHNLKWKYSKACTVITVNMMPSCGRAYWISPPAGEVIQMTQPFPTVTPISSHQIIHQLVEMCHYVVVLLGKNLHTVTEQCSNNAVAVEGLENDLITFNKVCPLQVRLTGPASGRGSISSTPSA